MSDDPIIRNLGNGYQAWVWVDTNINDRNGTRGVIVDGVERDKWRVCVTLRASLAKNGEVVLLPNGKEMPVDLPPGFRSMEIDLADLVKEDPNALEAWVRVRTALVDWILRSEKKYLDSLNPAPAAPVDVPATPVDVPAEPADVHATPVDVPAASAGDSVVAPDLI